MDTKSNETESLVSSNQLKNKNEVWKWIAAVSFGLSIFVLTGTMIGVFEGISSDYEAVVFPTEGFVISVDWNDIGKQMLDAGVIDWEKFDALYAQRGGVDSASQQLLHSKENDHIEINMTNANIVLNILWAFGLANKNAILQEGPMLDPKYGGPQVFASTSGWDLSKGAAIHHYGKYAFITLTPQQQERVENVSQNVYRPCCGNSTYFPDCNHGMAMLGLLELMAAKGADEQEMYKTALQVNAYWFPNTYLTLAKYYESKEIPWSQVNPKEVLGASYSSSMGYQRILEEIEPEHFGGGVGCGV